MTRSGRASVAAIWFLFASGAWANSDYGPFTLFQLLTMSDVVVNGDVNNPEAEHYGLKLTRSFHQPDLSGTLTVIRGDIYPHDTRSGNFSAGQAITLFGRETGDRLIEPMGRAAEGEIIRDDVHVYIRAMSQPPSNLGRAAVPGGKGEGYRIRAEVFDEALDGFFRCYAPKREGEILRRCSDQALTHYRNSSWLANHLSGIAERRIRRGN